MRIEAIVIAVMLVICPPRGLIFDLTERNYFRELFGFQPIEL